MDQIKVNNNRVLLVGINFSPELTGIGKYSGEMIDWLSDNGYDCTAVTSFPYYPNWKIQKPYKAKFYKKEVLKNGKVQLYRCPIYVPEHPTGFSRILHDASFFLSAFFVVFLLLFKKSNDYIFCIAPPFHLGFLGVFYKFFKGGKLIYHIQDLQIEAARDLGIIKSNALLKLLLGMERFILKHSSHISSISSGMIAKVAAKVEKEIIFFPNWADTAAFVPVTDKTLLRKDWGFKPSDKIVLYSGSVGEKQGLESIVHIARELEAETDLKFLVCGDGPYKENLIKMAERFGLKNMLFLPLQPLAVFNDFLNMTDVHLVLQKKNACDLMMPSKLTTIWSSGGLALVTAEPGSTLHSLILGYNIGVVIGCENQDLLSKTILECCRDDHQLKRHNARKYAEQFLSKRSILKKLMCGLDNKMLTAAHVEAEARPSNVLRESVPVNG
ncbi:MAG TPA: WcaI family glycosyltransferase [Pedobacter sp.]|nr:WcaI family glycosyltransferase [Pedobacter sp.]